MVVQKTSKVLGILHVAYIGSVISWTKINSNCCIVHCLNLTLLTVWSSPHKNGNLDRILRLQKRAVRIITHSSFLAHSASLFKALNILTIYDLTHLSVLVHMFRATRNLLPHKFSSYLIHMDQIHSHFTRGSVNYAIPFAWTTLRMASLQVMGPRLWNSLPTHFKQTQSICTLKKELKLIFFSKYKDTLL